MRFEFPYDKGSFKDRYTRQHREQPCSTIVAHLSKDGLMFIHPTRELRALSKLNKRHGLSRGDGAHLSITMNTCSRTRFFPDRQAAVVHQTGAHLTDYQTGVEVTLHLSTADGVPICAEVSCGELHAEIGLWFADRELTDFDGAFSLPHEVAEMLREAGYEVAEDFLA